MCEVIEKTSNLIDEIQSLTHEDLLEITQSTLRTLITSDELLNDLPVDCTIEEVNSQIAVAHGQSITVHILRNLEPTLDVVIPQSNCTVRDLKKAIQRAFSLKQKRSRSRSQISWRYVWRTYNLKIDREVMYDDKKFVNSYGVKNGCNIQFVKRLLCVICSEYPWFDQVLLQDTLASQCDQLGLNQTPPITKDLDHILVDHKHKLLYCYVPKVACTNWKRILMVLTGAYNTTDPLSIPASLVHEPGSLLRLSDMDPNEAQSCLQSYMKFIMVRHPFERLLSAYRNKLEGNLPSAKYFQARVGRYIVKNYRQNPSTKSVELGNDVTFLEFVKYLITPNSEIPQNEHWQPIYQLCHPCSINYTYIANYEHLVEHSEQVLAMIGANGKVSFPITRTSGTRKKMPHYFTQLPIDDIAKLYEIYKNDFKLFGYQLDDVIGYDLGV